MPSALTFVAALLPFLAVVAAQERFCDGPSNVCFTRASVGGGATVGFVAPNGGTDEFVGLITAPSNIGYVGISLGGSMTNSLLLVGWTDGNRGIVSPRYTEEYAPPGPYSGPRVTVYGAFSGKNGTQQKIIFRCQGCTSWRGGGSVNLANIGLAWAISTSPVSNPGDANTSLKKHSSTGSVSLSANRDSNYSAALSRLAGGGGAPASSNPPASRTTSAGSRVTGSSPAGSGSAAQTSATATLSGSSVSTATSASTATDSTLSGTSTDTLGIPSTGIPIPTESTTSGAMRAVMGQGVTPLVLLTSWLLQYL